jgi:head-tail adaptor
MRSGKLRNKATIYIPSTVTNEWGEVEQSYTELGTYHCSALTKPRREYEESDSVVSKTEYDLRFRYYSELTTLPRNAYIILKGMTLEITSIANVMLRDREIQMICEERS